MLVDARYHPRTFKGRYLLQPEANLGFVHIRQRLVPDLNPGAYVAVIHEPEGETFVDNTALVQLWALMRGHIGGWNPDYPAVIAIYCGTTGELHGVQPIGVDIIAEEYVSWN